VVTPGKINCHVLKEKSMFIDAQGRASPCCWQGARQQNFIKDDLKTLKTTWRSADAVDPICARICSTKINSDTVFKNQWQREIELNS
jgi:hypothetical protein